MAFSVEEPLKTVVLPPPPVATKLPPLRVKVPPLSSVCPTPDKSLSLTTVKFSAPAVDVMLLLRLMLLCAVRVRVASAPLVLLIAPLTLMSPACTPPELVVTLTLVPAFSAVSMLAVLTMALSAVEAKLGLPVTLASGPVAWMVMLLGSNSQVPPWPLGALAFGTVSMCSWP